MKLWIFLSFLLFVGVASAEDEAVLMPEIAPENSNTATPCLFECDTQNQRAQNKGQSAIDKNDAMEAAMDAGNFETSTEDPSKALFATDTPTELFPESSADASGVGPPSLSESIKDYKDYMEDGPYAEILKSQNLSENGANNYLDENASLPGESSREEASEQTSPENLFLGQSVGELQESVFANLGEESATPGAFERRSSSADALSEFRQQQAEQRRIINGDNFKKTRREALDY
jgi:hypothetical protein